MLLANSTSGVSSGQLSCLSLTKARRTSATTLLTHLTLLCSVVVLQRPKTEDGAQRVVQGCPKLCRELAVLIGHYGIWEANIAENRGD